MLLNARAFLGKRKCSSDEKSKPPKSPKLVHKRSTHQFYHPCPDVDEPHPGTKVILPCGCSRSHVLASRLDDISEEDEGEESEEEGSWLGDTAAFSVKKHDTDTDTEPGAWGIMAEGQLRDYTFGYYIPHVSDAGRDVYALEPASTSTSLEETAALLTAQGSTPSLTSSSTYSTDIYGNEEEEREFRYYLPHISDGETDFYTHAAVVAHGEEVAPETKYGEYDFPSEEEWERELAIELALPVIGDGELGYHSEGEKGSSRATTPEERDVDGSARNRGSRLRRIRARDEEGREETRAVVLVRRMLGRLGI